MNFIYPHALIINVLEPLKNIVMHYFNKKNEFEWGQLLFLFFEGKKFNFNQKTHKIFKTFWDLGGHGSFKSKEGSVLFYRNLAALKVHL